LLSKYQAKQPQLLVKSCIVRPLIASPSRTHILTASSSHCNAISLHCTRGGSLRHSISPYNNKSYTCPHFDSSFDSKAMHPAAPFGPSMHGLLCLQSLPPCMALWTYSVHTLLASATACPHSSIMPSQGHRYPHHVHGVFRVHVPRIVGHGITRPTLASIY